jgi:hypothetical protein
LAFCSSDTISPRRPSLPLLARDTSDTNQTRQHISCFGITARWHEVSSSSLGLSVLQTEHSSPINFAVETIRVAVTARPTEARVVLSRPYESSEEQVVLYILLILRNANHANS